MKKSTMVTVIPMCYFMGAFSGNGRKRQGRLTGHEPEWCRDRSDTLGYGYGPVSAWV